MKLQFDTTLPQAAYIAVLGRESDLAFVELAAVLQRFGFPKLERLLPEFARFSFCDDFPSIQALQTMLGGTIKIAKVNQALGNTSIDQLLATIALYVPIDFNAPKQKVVFGATVIGNNQATNRLQKSIKQYLSQQSINGRFVLGKHSGLSSVQLVTQNVLRKGFELLVLDDGKTMIVAQTVTFQNFKDWSKRDYDRPFADPYRGMMPPKLARMMLNIAAQDLPIDQSIQLLDPFCGEGTILQEGLALGMTVFGSDKDQKAIEQTKANLSWFAKQFAEQGIGSVDRLWQADIAHAVQTFFAHSYNIIATEPFLGNPAKHVLDQKSMQVIKRQYTPLFRSLLDTAKTLLVDGGMLAVVIPTVRNGKFSQVLVDQSVLDSCENFGYTLTCGPLLYSRPDAKIARALYFLRKEQ